MKKTITLFLFLGTIVCCSSSMADELVIHLKSGNTIHINYDGVIKGVNLEGQGDAIVGISMPQARIQPALHQMKSNENESSETKATKSSKEKDKKGSFFRLRWAKPIDDY